MSQKISSSLVYFNILFFYRIVQRCTFGFNRELLDDVTEQLYFLRTVCLDWISPTKFCQYPKYCAIFFFIFEIWAHHNLSHPTNYPFHASFIVVRSFCLYTQFVKAITVYQFYEVLARKIWINKKKTFAIQVTMGGPDFCCVQAVRGAPLESVTLQRFIFQAIFEFFDK